jgi:capsule polysaccharide export protein KpsC/LpsZ
MQAENRRGLQKERDDLIKQMEDLRNTAGISQKQKDELEAQIENIKQQHLTKEQQLAAELEKKDKKFKKDLDEKAAAATEWETRFRDLLVDQAITEAAIEHKAFNLEQFKMMLKTQIKMMPEADADGKPTGRFVAKMASNTIDPTTKQPVVMDLLVKDAVKIMKEDPKFANLFVSDDKGGFGGFNHPASNGKTDWANMSPEQHRAARKAQGIT